MVLRLGPISDNWLYPCKRGLCQRMYIFQLQRFCTTGVARNTSVIIPAEFCFLRPRSKLEESKTTKKKFRCKLTKVRTTPRSKQMKSPAHSSAQQDLARLPKYLLPYKISPELVFGKLPSFRSVPSSLRSSLVVLSGWAASNGGPRRRCFFQGGWSFRSIGMRRQDWALTLCTLMRIKTRHFE
ncbi:hypothetical protein AVEN_131715-1 [Araneus ventricosus]|uniref:Uncharacterized protein n=1 Tax=Araneus ventricosus TaxID=182803 RepID=A0A4Y2PWS7_ARAVE|nr:hypothetical protein AVEN_131715-1 [Araneus ventricosus]